MVTGKVIGVHDGDTLTLLIDGKRELKIRLEGIDAPESKQAFGERSKQALSDHVFGKEVRVQITTTDRYGRSIGRVFSEAIDINFTMVREGFAWWYRDYAKKDEELREAEAVAKESEAGLWWTRHQCRRGSGAGKIETLGLRSLAHYRQEVSCLCGP